MASTEEVRSVQGDKMVWWGMCGEIGAGRQDGMVGNVWSAKGLGEN